MKKLLILLISIPIVFSSCKKEEEEITPNTFANTILGEWTWVSEDYTSTNGYYTNYPNGKTIEFSNSWSYFPGDTIQQILSMTFEYKNNGILEIQGTYNDGSVWQEDSPYSISGSTLSDDNEDYTITTLTNSNLVIGTFYSDTSHTSNGTINFVEESFQLVFTK
jgi:hypothetical protein